MPLLEIDRVSKRFGPVHAVDGVSLGIARGEVLGLVGESGCGKSTLGRLVAGIAQPSAGQVRFAGQDMAGRRGRAKLAVQMIFQNPFASLNPRMRAHEIVGEAPRVHGLAGRAALAGYVDEQLRRAGLDPAYKRRFPHQFSGGQRQRIGIARALAVQPELLVCDEAVAALDVSIQAQIINLFLDLKAELGLTYLFISHDLGVVEHISDRVAVMYLGRIVELAGTAELFDRPNHPYTRALLAERPRIHTSKRQFAALEGELPSPLAPPPGCHFHPRCPHVMPVCRELAPPLAELAPGHASACHLNGMPPLAEGRDRPADL